MFWKKYNTNLKYAISFFEWVEMPLFLSKWITIQLNTFCAYKVAPSDIFFMQANGPNTIFPIKK